MFPFDGNLYLAEKKNMQSISVGNQSIIKKCFTSVLEKKITTQLFIGVPEAILVNIYFL